MVSEVQLQIITFCVINQPDYRQLQRLYLESLTGEDARPIADLVRS